MLSTERRTAPDRPATRARGRHRLRRAVGVAGRIFVGGGVILLLFTAYLLWGTGVYTKQEQRRAAKAVERNPIVTEDRLAGGNIPPARPGTPARLGQALFTLKIPKIGLDTVVVQGIGRDELKRGPGLFPDCRSLPANGECVAEAKYPGESGNVPVSGHRTTYGAPFFRLNELQKGDIIDFVSGRVRYRYKVREQKVVDPVAGFAVVEQHGRDEVTLTTCHPRFSASQRLIVHGDYVDASLVSGVPRSRSTNQRGPASSPKTVVTPDVLILGSVAAASALGALALSKHYRMAAAYASLVIVGTAGLWVAVFPRVLALMPANY